MPWIIAGGSVLSGLLGSSAAKSAASAQERAAQAQIAEQRRQYDLTRADQAPFRDTGVAANARLRYLLGLGGGGYTPDAAGAAGATVGAPGGISGATGVSAAGAAGVAGAAGGVPSDGEVMMRYMQEKDPALFASIGSTDPDYWERYLQAARSNPNVTEGQAPTYYEWDRYRDVLSRERAASAASAAGAGGAAGGAAGTGGAAGAPGTAGYDPSDPYGLKADKFYASGLQFGLDQGTGAINARAIAGGGYDSGATIKALTRYANDYGSTKANDVYNRLIGVSQGGQVATNATGAAGQNMANQVSEALGGAGNARAAGIVGGANAWTNAAQQGWNNYNNMQFNQALAKLRQPGGYSTAPSSFYSSNDPYNYMMGSN